jgi:hypothetical protein
MLVSPEISTFNLLLDQCTEAVDHSKTTEEIVNVICLILDTVKQPKSKPTINNIK